MLGLEAVVLWVVVLKFRQGFEFGQGVQSAELGLFLEPLSKFGTGIEFEGCAEAVSLRLMAARSRAFSSLAMERAAGCFEGLDLLFGFGSKGFAFCLACWERSARASRLASSWGLYWVV